MRKKTSSEKIIQRAYLYQEKINEDFFLKNRI